MKLKSHRLEFLQRKKKKKKLTSLSLNLLPYSFFSLDQSSNRASKAKAHRWSGSLTLFCSISLVPRQSYPLIGMNSICWARFASSNCDEVVVRLLVLGLWVLISMRWWRVCWVWVCRVLIGFDRYEVLGLGLSVRFWLDRYEVVEILLRLDRTWYLLELLGLDRNCEEGFAGVG